MHLVGCYHIAAHMHAAPRMFEPQLPPVICAPMYNISTLSSHVTSPPALLHVMDNILILCVPNWRA
jgi:hypothetical protein